MCVTWASALHTNVFMLMRNLSASSRVPSALCRLPRAAAASDNASMHQRKNEQRPSQEA